MQKRTSRRIFLQKCSFQWLAMIGIVAQGCSDNKREEVDALAVDQCDDLSKVSEEEIVKRKNFGYEVKSTMPDKKCGNCNLYIPAKEGQSCGGCILFKGPVFENAYCTYWAPQVG